MSVVTILSTNYYTFQSLFITIINIQDYKNNVDDYKLYALHVYCIIV